VKSIFGYKPYQLFGLLQAISALWSVASPNNHKQVRTLTLPRFHYT